MSYNRMYLKCKICGRYIGIGKQWREYENWHLSGNIEKACESFPQEYDNFIQSHSDCIMVDQEPFRIMYESDSDFGSQSDV